MPWVRSAGSDPTAELCSTIGRAFIVCTCFYDLIVIQITVSDTRTVEQKKQLFARIAAHLAASPGVRPQDVFINLLEVRKENWSFGNGVAQYA